MADHGIDTRIIRSNQSLFFPAYDGLRVTAQSGAVNYGTTIPANDDTIAQGEYEDFDQGVWLRADEDGVSVVLDYVTLDDRVDTGGGGGGGAAAAEDISVEGIDGLTDQQAYDEAIASALTSTNETVAGLDVAVNSKASSTQLADLTTRVEALENA